MGTLSFQHVEYTINGAEGSCTSTPSAAVHQNRPLALGFCLVAVKGRVTGGTDDLVTLLNEVKQMGRLRGCPKVGPVRVLKLGDIPKWLERE